MIPGLLQSSRKLAETSGTRLALPVSFPEVTLLFSFQLFLQDLLSGRLLRTLPRAGGSSGAPQSSGSGFYSSRRR